MSWRGSFVTEYIYCEACYKKAKEVLLSDNGKYFYATTIGSYNPTEKNIPIIAGKIGGVDSARQLSTFNDYFKPALERTLCHPLRIVFLPESEETVELVITPQSLKRG